MGKKFYNKRSKKIKANNKVVNVAEQLEGRREVTPEEEGVIQEQEEEKARLISLRRCPICKGAEKEGNYVFNPNLLIYVCCKCGGMFMDVKTAKEIRERSMMALQGERAKRLMEEK